MVKTLPEPQRIAKYTRGYFTDRNMPEIRSWFQKTLRTDHLSAMGYALGHKSYKSIVQALNLPEDPKILPSRTFDKLAFELEKTMTRTPKTVVDVGCGRGELLAAFHLLGVTCWGIDPAPGAASLVPETLSWVGMSRNYFINKGAFEGLLSVPTGVPIDTVIFCESIEHIRPEEFEKAFRYVKNILFGKDGGLLIIVNWIGFHPLKPDHTGYDHIRLVDDAFYDRLSKEAKRVVFRFGSHLVLEF